MSATISPLLAHLQTVARYHQWATRRLLTEHVATMTDDQYRQASGLFFGSVHGTLNHLLVGEGLLWFRRFSEGVSASVALDSVVEEDRAALSARLLALTDQWIAFASGLTDEKLSGRLQYTTTRGDPADLPFAATLQHVFNHATHHRGQVTAALTALGLESPELDMVYFLRSEATT